MNEGWSESKLTRRFSLSRDTSIRLQYEIEDGVILNGNDEVAMDEVIPDHKVMSSI